MTRNKIIYWVATILLSLLMIVQGLQGLFNTEMLAELYNSLGFPSALVIPLAIAKLLAVIAILSNRVKLLKKLAYYGLAIDFSAAIISHLIAGDGLWMWPVIAHALLYISYMYDRKLFT